jgi:SAM-dependent methyltransferase
MSNQDFFERGEADQWFIRNKKAVEKRGDHKSANLLASWLEPYKSQIKDILEIGCGTGHSLFELSKSLNANGFGVEPSPKAVSYLNKEFPKLKAYVGFGDAVPINRTFNLVHLGFFLYLVDREKYLRCVSEADRLVEFGGFLSIVDFETPFPYSNEYSHQKGVFSHKTSNSDVFVASGLYSIVNRYQFSLSNFHFDTDIDERVSLTLLYKEKELFNGIK